MEDKEIMIKYISCNDSCNLIKYNKENDEITTLNNISTRIDWIWIADEDGMTDNRIVNKGDIILRMYGIEDNNRQIIIIENRDLADYYKRAEKYRAEKAKQYDNCNDCCESRDCIR